MNTFTFEKSDRLGLKSFCEQLERYLLIEHEYVEGGLVVSLNAGFGAGKTTFINMWRADLQSRRDAGSMVPMPVVLNAWESDFCGDPLLAILAGLIDAIDSWKGEPKPKDKALLREAAKDAAWFI
jgi:KAP family P-loop domain